MNTSREKMIKFHDVQRVEFEGDDLILKVDNQVARIPIAEISPRLAQARGTIYLSSFPGWIWDSLAPD
jgi:hypothetical protein